jgi:hypothetical protein
MRLFAECVSLRNASFKPPDHVLWHLRGARRAAAVATAEAEPFEAEQARP